MATVQIAYYNALQLGTTWATPDSATNYYINRLYDFDVGKMWKGSATTETIRLTQSTRYDIDTLIIPEGHNLSGATIEWQYYYSAWVDAVTSWTQSDDNIIKKTMTTSNNSLNWRLVITHTVAPELAECWMTYLYSFEMQPQYNLSAASEQTFLKIDSISGKSTYIKLGKTRKRLEYSMFAFDDSDKTLLEDLEAYWRGDRPFFIIDHDGDEFFAELENELDIATVTRNSSKYFFSTNLKIRQVI